MLLGKRPRPPNMRRTTSMSGISLDMQEEVSNVEADQDPSTDPQDGTKGADRSVAHMARSPTARSNQIQNHRSKSAHFIETPHFLRTCGLCKRRLAPARDIYMYRGDTAFCSLECREQQMKQDEGKDKWKLASKKEDPHASPPKATSEASTTSETIAAA